MKYCQNRKTKNNEKEMHYKKDKIMEMSELKYVFDKSLCNTVFFEHF